MRISSIPPTRVDRLFLDRLAELKDLQYLAVPMRTAPHLTDVSALRAIRRYMHQAGPFDLIHGHSSKGGALARLATVGTRIPAFYTPHGLVTMDPNLALWKWLFYLSVEFGLSRQTARIIAVSPEEFRSAVQSGFGRNRVIMVPNGVRPGELTPRATARQVLEVDEDTVVIGFVGRLVEQKAPDVLVRAFAAAAAANPNVRLAMIGGGPLDESLRNLARDLKLTDKIIWLGERDARGVMAGFDLFALASRKEGLPYVVLEAMAAGLPVVATTTSGVEILVEPGVNGSVVRNRRRRGVGRNAMVELTADAKRRASFGQASKEMAGAVYRGPDDRPNPGSLTFAVEGVARAITPTQNADILEACPPALAARAQRLAAAAPRPPSSSAAAPTRCPSRATWGGWVLRSLR